MEQILQDSAVIHLLVKSRDGHTMPAMTFGANVRRALGAHDQTWLAKRMGVTPTMVNRWIKGKNLKLTSVLRIAAALGVSVESLIGGIDPAYDDMRAAVTTPDDLVEVWKDLPEGYPESMLRLLRQLAGHPVSRGHEAIPVRQTGPSPVKT